MTKGKKNEKPELYAVKRDIEGLSLSRRGFLSAASLATAGSFLSSCNGDKFHFDLRAHQYAISAIRFNPNGKVLVSSGGGKLKAWSIPEGKLISSVKDGSQYKVQAVSGFRSARALPMGGGRPIQIALSSNHGKHLEGHVSKIKSMAFSPDGKQLASADVGGNIIFWSALDGELLSTIEAHKKDINCIAFSPDGSLLASCSGDKTIKFWSAENHKLLKTLKGHRIAVESIAFSPDGRFLASGASDLKLWSVPDAKLLKTIREHRGFANSVAVSPDGSYLAVGSSQATLVVFSLPDVKFIKYLFDPECSEKADMKEYSQMGPDIAGVELNEPIPSDAACICDTVDGRHTYYGESQVCTCDTVVVSPAAKLTDGQTCVCNTVSIGTDNPRPESGGGGGSSSSYWYPN
jgi:WD40 repeat protein